MKKIILAIVLFFTTFCLGFAEQETLSIGCELDAWCRFSEIDYSIRVTEIYAILPYQDGYIIKFGTENHLVEYFAKVGSVFYVSVDGKYLACKIIKISPNQFTIETL